MKLIIFDVDDTLVFSDKLDSKAFAATYEQVYGQPFPTIDWHNFPHVTDWTIFQTAFQGHFGRQAGDDEIRFFHDCFVARIIEHRQHCPADFYPVAGASQALVQLQSMSDVAIGIATGGWKKPAEVKLDHVGIDHSNYFFQGGDWKATREHIIEAVLEEAQSVHGNFEHVVYVGDALWDLSTTRNLNMNFLGIRRRNDHDYLYQAGATAVISDYTDFPAFWQALLKAAPPQKNNEV